METLLHLIPSLEIGLCFITAAAVKGELNPGGSGMFRLMSWLDWLAGLIEIWRSRAIQGALEALRDHQAKDFYPSQLVPSVSRLTGTIASETMVHHPI